MEGPPLYNLYADYAIRAHENRKTEAGVTGLCIPYEIPNEATNRAQKELAPSSGTLQESECGCADAGVFFCWTVEEYNIIICTFISRFPSKDKKVVFNN